MKFSDMNLPKGLKNALSSNNFTEATVIQEQSFGLIMSGRDVIAIAQTGTGKTLAYLLPCLAQWKFDAKHLPQIVIVVPTRELVLQVLSVVEMLTAEMSVKAVGVYGGVGTVPQAEKIAEGADVLIGTPGRLMDLILNGYAVMKNVRKLVIDEVDEMLAQGFNIQLERLLDLMPKKRQNLMFSATITAECAEIAENFFNSPEKIEVVPTGTPLENIEQMVYMVPNFNTKINLLIKLLKDKRTFKRVLIFCSTIDMVTRVFGQLKEKFEDVEYIHSRKTQAQRFKAVEALTNEDIRVLVASDLVGRGIDISQVSHTINFDLPLEASQYIHRIGRTGRMENQGVAISLITEKDKDKWQEIKQMMHFKPQELQIPDEVEISEELCDFELPTYRMRNSFVTTDATPGKAFHEKLEKNKKVNKRRNYKAEMMKKYGKPKTKPKPKNKH